MTPIDQIPMSRYHRESIFVNEIVLLETDKVKAAERPRAIITGGQPGSEQSILAAQAYFELRDQKAPEGTEGCVFVSVADLHRYHEDKHLRAGDAQRADPTNEKAMAQERDRIAQRGEDCEYWAKRLVEGGSDARCNIVIDQASANPVAVRDLADQLHKQGYIVEFRAMAVKDVVSEARMQWPGGDPAMGPAVTKGAHGAACTGLEQTVEYLEKWRNVDAISLYDRDLKPIYSNRLVERKWVEPPEALRALQQEQDRPFTHEERQAQDAFLQRIDGQLRELGPDAAGKALDAASDLRERSHRVEVVPKPEAHKLSEVENERVFQEVIKPQLVHMAGHGLAPQAHPQAVILEAQPGAGTNRSKAHALDELLQKPGSALEIDADGLHKYHRDHDALMRLNDRRASDGTRADVDIWARKAEEFGRENRFNVLFKGAATSHEGLVDRCSQYRDAGYAVEARVVATHERTSRQALIERYETQRAEGAVGVVARPETHDTAYTGVVKSVGRVENLRLADRVRVDTPDGKQVYLAQLQPDGSLKHAQSEMNVVRAIERTRNAEWTPARWDAHVAGTDRIDARLAHPDRHPRPEDLRAVQALRKVDEVARQESQLKLSDKPKASSPGR